MSTAEKESAQGVGDERTGLADRIARWAGGRNSVDTPIKGLSLHRWAMPTEPTSYMLPRSICLIGQGRKRLFVGEETYTYDARKFLITSVDLPVVGQVIEADSGAPYLGLTLELDLRVIAHLMLGENVLSDPADSEIPAPARDFRAV